MIQRDSSDIGKTFHARNVSSSVTPMLESRRTRKFSLSHANVFQALFPILLAFLTEEIEISKTKKEMVHTSLVLGLQELKEEEL